MKAKRTMSADQKAKLSAKMKAWHAQRKGSLAPTRTLTRKVAAVREVPVQSATQLITAVLDATPEVQALIRRVLNGR